MADVLFLCTGNYYRSRFAELWFDHLAVGAGSPLRAASRGLRIPADGRNPGPVSPYVRQALLARDLPLPEPVPGPIDLAESDLHRAIEVVALYEPEHRPMIALRFPSWVDRVRYWDVADVPLVPAGTALPRIEALVAELLAELSAGSTPGGGSPGAPPRRTAGSRPARTPG
jgi:protein-tyrosine phosphatase